MLVDLQEWRLRSACIGTPIDWWYPPGGDANVGRPRSDEAEEDRYDPRARMRCTACVVRSDCLEHALRRERFGLWANTTMRQRERLRRASGITLRELSVEDVAPAHPSIDAYVDLEEEEEPRWLS